MVLELSGGLGIGSGTGHAQRPLTGNTFQAEGNYVKPFLQANTALQSRALDIGLVNRLSIIQFSEITETSGSSPESIPNPSTPLFWEPSIYMQLGWDWFRVNLNIGFSGPVAGQPDFDWNGVYLSSGLSFRFGGREDS